MFLLVCFWTIWFCSLSWICVFPWFLLFYCPFFWMCLFIQDSLWFDYPCSALSLFSPFTYLPVISKTTFLWTISFFCCLFSFLKVRKGVFSYFLFSPLHYEKLFFHKKLCWLFLKLPLFFFTKKYSLSAAPMQHFHFFECLFCLFILSFCSSSIHLFSFFVSPCFFRFFRHFIIFSNFSCSWIVSSFSLSISFIHNVLNLCKLLLNFLFSFLPQNTIFLCFLYLLDMFYIYFSCFVLFFLCLENGCSGLRIFDFRVVMHLKNVVFSSFFSFFLFLFLPFFFLLFCFLVCLLFVQKVWNNRFLFLNSFWNSLLILFFPPFFHAKKSASKHSISVFPIFLFHLLFFNIFLSSFFFDNFILSSFCSSHFAFSSFFSSLLLHSFFISPP